ncbi:hypothetical protein C5167_014024 [Papaver somniferum]|uniref:Uncharacterized protein n=1 Tax=Papaver somniferum TaxID=3469 RepID=A0A4Y7J525_PAPSO|nr:hypothetical protein C5167_014024 [Papaver somniferum]
MTQSHPLVKQFPFKTKPGFISKDPKARVRKVWIDDIERLVLEKLDKKGHEEEVVCLICLYMLVVLFFCRSSGDNLDISYVGLVKDLENMDSVSFPDLIHEHLMESIKTVKRNNLHIRNCSGCTIYSLLWLAEYSNIDEISSDIVKVISNATPRAAKWDLAAMKKAMLKKNITFLKTSSITMDSYAFKLVFSLVIILVSTQNLSSVAAVVTSALPAPNPGVAPVPSSKPTNVSLALYYDTLCLGCTNFIVNNFPKIFTSGITDIMDLKLVPYGNAIVGENNTIICQHRPKECFLNQVEACAILAWPVVETGVRRETYYELYTHLSYNMRMKLVLLSPLTNMFPWVTVNKVPVYDDYDNFLKGVCKAYKGTPLPRVCQKPTTDINPEAKSNSNQEVCYVDEASPTAKVRPSRTIWKRLMKF